MQTQHATGRITTTLEDGIADVRLTRPDKMNALDDAMFEALIDTGDSLSRNPDVRVIILSGEGRAFSAGLDMGNFARMASPGATPGTSSDTQPRSTLGPRTHGIANRAQQATWTWRSCPVPVIAALHGVCLGGGLQVALGADVRLAHPDTKLSIMELKWGLIPDMGGTPMLRELLREDVLRELIYTARTLTAAEAQRLGLVTRLAEDPHAEALALAREIAQKSPDAIRAAKQLLNALPDSTAAEALQRESDLQDQIIARPNQVEAVMSTLEKRPPRYANAR
jgi:enoyl-CoA hydratase/carnithine racemase